MKLCNVTLVPLTFWSFTQAVLLAALAVPVLAQMQNTQSRSDAIGVFLGALLILLTRALGVKLEKGGDHIAAGLTLVIGLTPLYLVALKQLVKVLG